MRIYTKEQLIAQLKREGLVFSEFSVTHEGAYTPEDADWNYKDVPHLHHVHNLVEAVFSFVDNHCIATINMQKVLGLTFPMSVFNYESGPNEQTYYTTWFFFALIVNTKYQAIGENRTRVVTTYSVGSPGWLKWCFPMIRWVLKRNYDDLMSSDIPMRERKGELRSWGYGFKSGGTHYSFERTMDIASSNVILSRPSSTSLEIDIRDAAPVDGEYYFGRSDHIGVRVIRDKGSLKIFPRMCLHEGARLDGQPCSNGRIKCPWHGRTYQPLAVFDLNEQSRQEATAQYVDVVLDNFVLQIAPREPN